MNAAEILGLLTVLAAVLLWQIVTEGELQSWARGQRVTLTPANRQFVKRYIATARHRRTVCAVGGIVLPPLILHAHDSTTPVHPWLSWLGLFVGYMVGTLWAEWGLRRPAGPGARAASLEPRGLADYLPRHLRLGLRVVGPVTAAAWLSALALQGHDSFPGHRVSAPMAVGWAIVSLMLPIIVELTQRWLIRRPQPVAPPDLLAADDAARSRSLHELGGTAIAVDLFWSVAPLLTLAQHLPQPFAEAGLLGAITAFLAGVGFWRHFSHGPWQVSRGLGLLTNGRRP